MNTLRLSIYTSMNTFSKPQPLSACASNILDTLSDILDKCLLNLIKIESVSIFQAKPHLVASFLSVVYTFTIPAIMPVVISPSLLCLGHPGRWDTDFYFCLCTTFKRGLTVLQVIFNVYWSHPPPPHTHSFSMYIFQFRPARKFLRPF